MRSFLVCFVNQVLVVL